MYNNIMEIVKHAEDIVEFKNFLKAEECNNLIEYFNSKEYLWEDSCFYKADSSISSPGNWKQPVREYSATS